MGQVIGERYQIQREIGAGGMGTVFLARDKQTQASVAIKQLKREMSQPEMIERFKREGQALRELNHPNIVKLLDALEVEGQQYLVMEYVAGGDLRQLLATGKLPYQRCLHIAIDLADALTRAHRLNIIHRDLKPANVLIAEDGTIRLSDFGVAHVVDKERVTETNAIVGTLDYLPPEVLNGEAVEPRSDIWAFGVMLFEMLAGQRPFSGTGYLQILQAIVSAPLPDLEALAPDAPIALVDLVYRMVNRDVQARISSVRHVGAELEDILHGRQKQSRFENLVIFNPPKHNFPVQVGDFVGREEELRQIARFYAEPKLRLLTIVGQGGMGKTRLMLEVAWRLMSENNDLLTEYPDGYKDGGYFVELAPLRTVDEVIAAIAQAVGYQFQNDEGSQKQQLLAYLQSKELGLLLDNFEHIMEASSIVAEIMQSAPSVRIAVTSRERLNLPGEQVFQLKGIEFPETGKLLDALDYPAIKLFLQTAKRVNPAYEMGNEDLAGIVEICKLAEGLPLAIILAASWLEMLAVEEVLAEMKKSIDFLASNSRGTVERHRSMRAVFEYSWQLLSEVEQDVFAKFAVFRGGFRREAAEAVAGANLRVLMGLVNKSLLRRDNTTGRYEIHELLRQYGEEKIRHRGSDEVLHSHARFYASFLAQRFDGIYFKSAQDIRQIHEDKENIVAAWQFIIERFDNSLLEYMLMPMFFFLNTWKNPYEALIIAENSIVQFEAMPQLEKSLILGQAYLGISWVGFGLDLEKTRQALLKSEAILEQYPDSPSLAAVYSALITNFSPEFDSSEKHELGMQKALKALKIAEATKSDVALAFAYRALMNIENVAKNYSQAIEYGTKYHDVISTKGFSSYVAVWSKYDLALILAKDGQAERAIELLESAQEISLEWEQLFLIGMVLYKFVEVYASLGNREKALSYGAQYMLWHSRLGKSWEILGGLMGLIFVKHQYGLIEATEAIQLASLIFHHPESIPFYRQAVEMFLPALKNGIEESGYLIAWEAGKTLDLEAVVQEILQEKAG